MNNVYITWLIRFELQQMNDLLDVLSVALQDYEQKLEDAYTAEELENLDDEGEKEYEHYLDIFSSMFGDFPRRLYSSFLVSWYSIVEDTLTQLCIDLNLTILVRFQDQEGFGSGFQRAKNFLIESGQVNINQTDWQEMEFIRKIRNQIVHKGGKFQISREKPDRIQAPLASTYDGLYYIQIDKQLYDYMERYSLLHFYNTFLINPSLEYCRYLVDFGKNFFSKILSDLNLT